MRTLPVEFRHRVVELTADGYTTAEIAELLGTSTAWVRSVKALDRAGRPLEPKTPVRNRKSLAAREGDRLRAAIRAKPGITLGDLKRDLGLDASISNIWYALRDLKIGLKKKRSTPASGPAPTSKPRGRSGSRRPR